MVTATEVKAQNVSINAKSVLLYKVFKQIEKQTDYLFWYKGKMEDKNVPITVSFSNMPVKSALDKIFADIPFSYEIVGKTIVVKEKPAARESTKERQKKQIITGTVTDEKDYPLVGVSVRIRGTNRSVITGQKGAFSLEIQGEQVVLQFSYVGYETHEQGVNDSARLLVKLKEGTSLLQGIEVVSTGYQILPKERATGSFSQPLKEMYNARVSTDVISKLEGITSGLVFNGNTTHTLSGKADISIRGRSTIFANDQPLIVIDNFPYSGDINNINPNDIESITVLKDAAAASIWGVRAGNGVIVLTTKKGRLNQPFQIILNSNITISGKPDLFYNPAEMGTSDFIDMEQFLFAKGKYNSDLRNTSTFRPVTPVVEILALQRSSLLSASDAASQIDALRKLDVRNDLTKYLYRNNVKQQYSLNINGGSERAAYYLSAGYDQNLQHLKENAYDRLTLNSSLTFSPIKNLQIGTNINYIRSNTSTDNTASTLNTGGSYAKVYPYAQLADADGNPLPIVKSYRNSFIQSAPSKGYLDWSYVPLKDLGLAEKDRKSNDIRLSPTLKYTLFKGLDIEAKYQYEQYTVNSRDLESEETFYTRNLINRYSILGVGRVVGYHIPLGGILYQSLSTVSSYNARGQVNYSGSWQKHSVTAIAGIEQNQIRTDGSTSTPLYGYDNHTGISGKVDFLNTFPLNPGTSSAMIPNNANISGQLDRVRSYFGNAAYTYDHKYTASISGRIDGSNYFGVNTNQKSVPLWSVGGKWAVNREGFYKWEWLPHLQFRASYGYNGNLNRNVTGITTSRYLLNSDWTGQLQADISNIGNPDLKWEKAGIANFGVDFATRNNTITGSIEYFHKNGEDLIGDASVAPSTGATIFRGNFASMKGRGIDIQLTSKNVRGTFSWVSSLLLSYATDKVTRYTAPLNAAYVITSDGTSSSINPTLGKPVYGIWSYQWAGLDPATGDPRGYVNGAVSKDYYLLANPLTMNELVYNGPARPVYFGGLNNRFGYKSFGLFVNITYKLGHYFRRSSVNYYTLFSNWIGGHKEFSNRWKTPGDEQLTTVPSMIYPADPDRDNFYNYSEVTVEKADHIRLQDISISYDFNKKSFRKLPVSNIQLYAYANNLGIIWRANKLKLDPDYPTGMPVAKSISLGVKVDL
jgi:TonB-linked SusC/RagA family outer membrane protein